MLLKNNKNNNVYLIFYNKIKFFTRGFFEIVRIFMMQKRENEVV